MYGKTYTLLSNTFPSLKYEILNICDIVKHELRVVTYKLQVKR